MYGSIIEMQKNVLVDSRPLMSQKSGIGYYVQNLIEQLKKKDDICLDITHSPVCSKVDRAIKTFSTPAKHVLGEKYPSSLAAKCYDLCISPFVLNFQKCNEKTYDIFHETNFFSPPNTYSRKAFKSLVVDVHDVICFTNPEYFTTAHVAAANKAIGSLLEADCFIAKSQYSKSCFMEYFA